VEFISEGKYSKFKILVIKFWKNVNLKALFRHSTAKMKMLSTFFRIKYIYIYIGVYVYIGGLMGYIYIGGLMGNIYIYISKKVAI